ncbi:MAG: AAA domain-containing protein [Reichenbachiella sp.]|uniref:AAA domain-containing protein n=1 Tax=Reichenbachiella sp. TaxID=2184521 RepID=UPI003263D05F
MTKNWIKYWRNSLADGERMEKDISKMEFFQQENLELSEGKLPVTEIVDLIDKYEKKVNRNKGIDDPESIEWIEINQVSLVISPFSLLPKYEHTKKLSNHNQVYPFWINATVDKNGRLTVPEVKIPMFIRKVLDPVASEDQLLSLGSVEQLDKIIGEGAPDTESWEEYWKFINQFFQKVTGQETFDFKLNGIDVVEEQIIAIDEEIAGASEGIIKLYDRLYNSKEVPKLFQALANSAGSSLRELISKENWHSLLSEHIGQMGNSFPLSFSQRQSLHHFKQLGNGDVLAVNGPPGTGKTTLLQSIVANEFVSSALMGEAPKVILACSTNNQAVTNIIESFGKADSNGQGLLADRWLPKIGSYALYMPASSTKPKKGVHYVKYKNGKAADGLPVEIENAEYLDEAKNYYIEQAQSWFGEDFSNVKNVVTELRYQIQLKVETIKQASQHWAQYLSILKALKKYSSRANSFFVNESLDSEVINCEFQKLEKFLEGYYNIKQSESIWLVLFSFLSFIRERRMIPYKRLFKESELLIDELDFNKISEIEGILESKIKLLKKVIEIHEGWNLWKKEHKLSGDPPSLFDELDQSIRHECFLFATHYWEGRWLLETEKVVDEDIVWMSTEEHMQARYRRYAMLTPCFVATFYMAPKFFGYYLPGGGFFPQQSLLSFIDLLIVDEAGQVTPEVGAATFALAQKALVVGDIKQIDPIWKIPKQIDRSNLEKFGLPHSNDQVESLETKGFTASKGSTMRMAQNASYYQASRQEAKGMLLVEHRRCFNEIVGYCNELAYNGLLQPLRGSIKNQKDCIYPSPVLGYAHVQGESSSQNGSRVNELEATAIASWLLNNQQKIFTFYDEIDRNKAINEGKRYLPKSVEEYLGIITPFAAQKFVLRKILKQAGFNTSKLTIGTVHALQGAERPVIIFSSVYASNENQRSFFFDSGVNMLNVAVSRAKDSFILFGDLAVFDEKAKSPSGMLINRLDRIGEEILVG